jgi:hypothetical protein
VIVVITENLRVLSVAAREFGQPRRSGGARKVASRSRGERVDAVENEVEVGWGRREVSG